MNERQIELIATATPKREYFFVTPEGSRLFELDLSPAVLAVYGLAGPAARGRVARWRETHGAGWLRAALAGEGHQAFADLLDSFHPETSP